MGIERKLLGLKEKIRKAQRNKDQSEGRKAELIKRLKTSFKCSSIPAANKKLDKMRQQISSLSEDLKKGVEELEENYEI